MKSLSVYLCLLVLVLLALALQPDAASAQLGKLKERAKQHAAEKVTEKVIQKQDKALGNTTESQQENADAQDTPSSVSETESQAEALAAAPSVALKPGEGAWANYDFVPGERPLFVEDFSRDKVGDFPRRLEFAEGNMEIVEWQGSRYLRVAEGKGRFTIPLPETLPERFTIEFDLSGINKYELKLDFVDNYDLNTHTQIAIGSWGSGVQGGGVTALGKLPEDIESRMTRVRVMADGRYVKVYMDGQRVANVPNANLGRANKIWVEAPAYGELPILIGNLSIMAGGNDLYDALTTEGRVTTQGIFFDAGSDRLRPESTPTLKEIGEMLKAYPDLRISIEGHTDNTGSAETNQCLSEQRAAAVRAFLIDTYALDAARLETQGFGPSKPVAANDTPEGRQQNRRVELVRR